MAISLEQYVQNLIRAGLFTAEELAAFQDSLPPDHRPQEPKDLARELIHAGRLTKYQAARGLECAHEQGVVHRDIKPGNLLLDRKGTVKILDMGLARIDQPPDPRVQTAPEALTESGQVMGTYDYMAPEQAQDTHGADHRADIYSLGCTLYRLLTGEKPYHGDTPVATLLAHCQAPIPSIRETRGDVSPELDGVVRKMLAKDPAEWQQSMGEVIAELESCIRPASPSVPEPPTPPPVEQPATSSSSSDSALKAFLRRLSGGALAAQAKPTVAAEETGQLQREQETSVLAGRRAPSQAARKKALLWLGIGGGIVAVVLLLALGLSLFGGGGAEQDRRREMAQAEQKKEKGSETARPTTDQGETCLLIQWPKSDRADAKLEVDGRPVELAGADIQSVQERLKIPTEPGSHRIWIARRGFAPYEVQIAITQGQSLEITPEWGAAPGLVEGAEPRPEQAAAKPEPQPTTPEPSQMAEKPPPSQPEPEPPKPEVPELDPEEEKRFAAEKRYTEALAPAEDMVAAWEFRDALTELEKLHFEDEDFAARLASRREQVEQLAQLKSRIIDKLNTADPSVTKADLKIRGVGGDIVKADEEGITAQLKTKTETRAWNDLGGQATKPLLDLVIDPQKPEDLLAAGLLAMACKDTSLAERYFDRARQLGVDVGPYLAPLAQTAFTRARELLDKGQFAEAGALLTNVQAEYSDIPWFAVNRKVIAAAGGKAKEGIYETEAEKLYLEAAELFQKQQLFDVKPLVKKLKSDYADSQAVTDAARQPSFAEMEKATENLGRRLVVRQDGKGDYRTIREAINAAPSDSVVEIHDNGPYSEAISFRAEQTGVTLRGSEDSWPLIVSLEPNSVLGDLITLRGRNNTLEKLVFVNRGASGRTGYSVAAERDCPSGRIHRCLTCGARGVRVSGSAGSFELTECVLLAPTVLFGTRRSLRESLVIGHLDSHAETHGSTVLHVRLGSVPCLFEDFILQNVDNPERRQGHGIEHCVLYGDVSADVARGEGVIVGQPQFRDPANLDYRLLPASPCIGKASDGGDIGCRYTPEMIEMVQKALELRAKGIIKF